jgi:hypothetical protein
MGVCAFSAIKRMHLEGDMPKIEPEKSSFEWRQEIESLKDEQRKLKDLWHSDHDLILAIQDILDGTTWEAWMLSEIADLLTNNGYAVADRK